MKKMRALLAGHQIVRADLCFYHRRADLCSLLRSVVMPQRKTAADGEQEQGRADDKFLSHNRFPFMWLWAIIDPSYAHALTGVKEAGRLMKII